MTQMNHSPKRPPMGASKDHRNRNSSPLSSLVPNSPRRSNKAVSLGSLNTDRKRRAVSVSSVSSVSSIEELSDDANGSEEDADDEDDRPAVRAPSYGRRNRPHKTGVNTTKGNKKRRMDGYDGQSDENDSFDSSDDIYAAVDYISDGDDDEDQDVEKLEELLIVESEDEHDIGGLLSTPNAVAGAVDPHSWTGPNVFDDHMLLAGASFFDDEQLYGAMQTFGETDMASETAVETPVPRRVHFEEDSDSSSDSDSHTDDEIPGDFLQQDSLDPQLRRMIENDAEPYRRHRRQSDEMFAESDYGHSNIYHVESDARSDASESSGYESMQDTTLTVSVCFYADPLLQPMTVKLQMKTSPLRPPSLTRDPFSAGTLPLPWPRPRMRRASPPLDDEALSWERSSRILTNQWLWWTAPASIS